MKVMGLMPAFLRRYNEMLAHPATDSERRVARALYLCFRRRSDVIIIHLVNGKGVNAPPRVYIRTIGGISEFAEEYSRSFAIVEAEDSVVADLMLQSAGYSLAPEAPKINLERTPFLWYKKALTWIDAVSDVPKAIVSSPIEITKFDGAPY